MPPICRHYASTGRCKRGTYCGLLHQTAMTDVRIPLVKTQNAHIQHTTRSSISTLFDPPTTPTAIATRSVPTPDSSSQELGDTTTHFQLELKVARLELEIMRMLNAQLEAELQKARQAQFEAENQAEEACRAQDEAERRRKEAIRAHLDAEDRWKLAVSAHREAEKQVEEANRAKAEAERKTEEAVAAQKQAERQVQEVRRGKDNEESNAHPETECREARTLQEVEKATQTQVVAGPTSRLAERITGQVEPKVKPVSDGILTVLDRHCTRNTNRSFHIWRSTDSKIFPIVTEIHSYATTRENNATIQRLLWDSTLITFGAGLNILSMMCGFNNGFVAIHGLPLDVREDEIEALFAGLDTRFYILDTRQYGDGTISVTAVVEADQKQSVANRLNGKIVRNKIIGANIVDATPHPAAPPYILNITWEFPSRGALRTTMSDFYLQEFYISLRRELESSAGLLSSEFKSLASKYARSAATACFSTWSSAKKVHDALAGKRLKPHFPVMRCTLRPNEPKTAYTLCVPLELRNIHESGSTARSKRNTALSGTSSIAKTVEYHYLCSGWFDGWRWSSDLKTVEFFEYNLARKDLGISMIKRDWMKKSLTFYTTTQGAMNLVSDEIEKFLRRSNLAAYAIETDRRFIRSFNKSARLAALKQRLGEDAIWLDVECSIPMLKYRGYRSFNLIKRVVDEIQGGGPPQSEDEKKAKCLVCRREESKFIVLSCGHEYCIQCLKRYLFSAPARDHFPMTCIGDDQQCQQPITIPVMQGILSPVEFDELMEKAAASYVIQHRTQYKYCVTTTCMQLYRDNGGSPEALICPSCLISFCSVCRSNAHGNTPCPPLLGPCLPSPSR